jgi:hypothetical protein
MLANPLRDIGLSRHHALIERPIPGELQVFLLAIGGIGDGADSQDDFNHSHVLHSKRGMATYARFTAGVSNFDKDPWNYRPIVERLIGGSDNFAASQPANDNMFHREDPCESAPLDIRRKRAMFQNHLIDLYVRALRA